MNTIKYLQVFSITTIVIVLGLLITSSSKESYSECESVDKGLGLPLSVLQTIAFRRNTSYSEFDDDKIKNITSSLVDAVFWGDMKESISELKLDDNALLDKLSKRILDSVNKKLDKDEQPFKIVQQTITSKHSTTTKDYLISSRHVLYREGKMYGFVLNATSLWTNQNLELRGFTEVNPTGIVMEDEIFMLNTQDQEKYRKYGDSLSFIQSEAIMKDKSYEDDITQQQIYGLLQDRGISAKSFASN